MLNQSVYANNQKGIAYLNHSLVASDSGDDTAK